MGLLCRLDRSIYCEVYSQWVEAVRQLRETGFIIKAPSGNPIIKPLLSVTNKSADQVGNREPGRGREDLPGRENVAESSTPRLIWPAQHSRGPGLT